MLLPRSEVDQDAVLLEGGHLVADRLLRFGCSLADRCPHLSKYRLNVGRKLSDVLVDVLGWLSNPFWQRCCAAGGLAVLFTILLLCP